MVRDGNRGGRDPGPDNAGSRRLGVLNPDPQAETGPANTVPAGQTREIRIRLTNFDERGKPLPGIAWYGERSAGSRGDRSLSGLLLAISETRGQV